jgi:hypothetical protein
VLPISHPDRFEAKMPAEEWIKTLDGGRKAKFIYQELPNDGAFIGPPKWILRL